MRFSRDHRPKEGNCFVIMPFGVKKLRNGDDFDWDAHYQEVVAPVITEVGMTPIRADDIYGAQPLMERIWKGIQEAELVIADLTGRNANVMYELGLAHVIWKPVLLLTMDVEDVPTDLAQYVRIQYSYQGRGLVRLMQDLKKNLIAARAEPKTEAGLYPLPGGGVEQVAAKIVALTPEYAIVEASDGRKGFLNSEDASWIRRSPDLTRLFKIGEPLSGAFVSGVRGELKYSLIATEENPWPKLEAKFPFGQEFTSTVISFVSGTGAFVRMDFGINGLIPQGTLPRDEHLERGDEVKASTVKIDSSTKMVELRFIRKITVSGGGWEYSPGQRFSGIVVSVRPQNGFALVKVAEDCTGLLHISHMSERFRKQFDAGEVVVGSTVQVEIATIDRINKKLQFRDVVS